MQHYDYIIILRDAKNTHHCRNCASMLISYHWNVDHKIAQTEITHTGYIRNSYNVLVTFGEFKWNSICISPITTLTIGQIRCVTFYMKQAMIRHSSSTHKTQETWKSTIMLKTSWEVISNEHFNWISVQPRMPDVYVFFITSTSILQHLTLVNP